MLHWGLYEGYIQTSHACHFKCCHFNILTSCTEVAIKMSKPLLPSIAASAIWDAANKCCIWNCILIACTILDCYWKLKLAGFPIIVGCFCYLYNKTFTCYQHMSCLPLRGNVNWVTKEKNTVHFAQFFHVYKKNDLE